MSALISKASILNFKDKEILQLIRAASFLFCFKKIIARLLYADIKSLFIKIALLKSFIASLFLFNLK